MTELRELRACDIFPMTVILNKIGFSELKKLLTPERMQEMVKMFKGTDETAEAEEGGKDEIDTTTVLGMNLIFEISGILLENLPKIEKDLYKFLGDLSGQTPKDIADLPISDFAEMIVAVIKKEEFKDFFKAVSKLFK